MCCTFRLQNSRIFCERGRPSICKRKAVWSECENGEGEWGETLIRACEARAPHKRGSCLRRIAPSENVRKPLFCSLLCISCLRTFRGHLLCYSWFLWWLPSLFSTFRSLLWTDFSLWLILACVQLRRSGCTQANLYSRKREWSTDKSNHDIFWAGRKQKRVCSKIQDDLLFSSRIVRDRLLVVLIVDREWPLVGMRHDLLS